MTEEVQRPNTFVIIEGILAKHNLTPERYLAGRRHSRGFSDITKEICWRLRYEHNYTLKAIGKCLKLDHTSVLYHLRTYKDGANGEPSGVQPG